MSPISATLAHELRDPLAPIRQAALIAKAPTATEAQKRWSSEVISRQVQHMSLLLEDLLDISRVTRGTLELRTQMVELAEVVQAAVEPARPVIDAKRHMFSIELPPEPVHFLADPLRLAQVLSNLLTNAAKYTDPEGQLRLSASCAAGTITISVVDTGVGLSRPPPHERSGFQVLSHPYIICPNAAAGNGVALPFKEKARGAMAPRKYATSLRRRFCRPFVPDGPGPGPFLCPFPCPYPDPTAV
jgi:light-regulated signal transduction histidine kinase (bacteriophytochrome)